MHLLGDQWGVLMNKVMYFRFCDKQIFPDQLCDCQFLKKE
jgi:hypothetical protein